MLKYSKTYRSSELGTLYAYQLHFQEIWKTRLFTNDQRVRFYQVLWQQSIIGVLMNNVSVLQIKVGLPSTVVQEKHYSVV